MDEIISAKHSAGYVTGLDKLRGKRAFPSSPHICSATHNNGMLGAVSSALTHPIAPMVGGDCRRSNHYPSAPLAFFGSLPL